MANQNNSNTPEWKFSQMLPYEASGVVQLPNDQLLVINDEIDRAMTLLTLDGNNIAFAITMPKDNRLNDLEGVTLGSDGHVYVITGKGKLMRFVINDNTVMKLSVAPSFKKDMQKHLGTKKIDIEGLAWNFTNGSLLIGVRKPLTKKDRAKIVLLTNPDKIFSDKQPTPKFGKTIKMDLDGNGVRDITGYNVGHKDRFLILAGPSNGGRTAFCLWELNYSNPAHPSVNKVPIKGNPNIEHAEGIAVINNNQKLLMLCDRSSELDKVDKAVKGLKKGIRDTVALEGKYMLVPLNDQ